MTFADARATCFLPRIPTLSRGKTSALADGVVITPSRNPPKDGGFKYNPPIDGPADTSIAKAMQERADDILQGGRV